MFNIIKAMKFLKSKEVPEKLLDFHSHLIIYLIWLREKKNPNPELIITPLEIQHESFLIRATQYMQFLDSLGVEIPLLEKEDAKSYE